MGIIVATNISFRKFSRVYRRVTKMTKGQENMSLEKSLRKLHLFSLGRRLRGHFTSIFQEWGQEKCGFQGVGCF